MRARASGACCSFITHDSPSNAIHVHFFVQDTAYLRPLVDVKYISSRPVSPTCAHRAYSERGFQYLVRLYSIVEARQHTSSSA